MKSSATNTIQIIADCGKTRLDVYLAGATERTRSQIGKLIEGGHITVNGKVVKSGKTIETGDEIIICEPVRETNVIAQDIPLDILYEDGDIAIINKQRGLSAHPAGGAVTNTLVNALLHHFENLSGAGGELRPGIVHRLDKDTTGVLVVAKNDKAHLSLSRQIAERTVTKLYHAVLERVIKEESIRIDAPIGRSRSDRKKMAITTDGRAALSILKVLKRFEEHTLAEFDLRTGRTHQIRVHAAHIGHPVVGDSAYGFKKQRFNLPGQLLHSYSLTFVHPTTAEKMTFTAPQPQDFERVLKVLRARE